MGRRFGTWTVLAGAVLLAMGAGLWSGVGRQASPAQAATATTAQADDEAARAGRLFRIEGMVAPKGTPQRVSVSREAVADAMRTGELPVELPDGTRYVVHMAREETAPGGNWTAIGHVRTVVGRQAMVLTFGRDAVFGVLPRPDGFQLQLSTTRGVTTLAPAGGIRPTGASVAITDVVVPPRTPGAGSRGAVAAPPVAGAQADGPVAVMMAEPTEIDLLLLYSEDLATLRGSAEAAETEITNLLATANQSYLESGTGIVLKLRGLQRVVVDAALSDYKVLEALRTNGVQGADIRARRDELGADLVALIRPHYSNASDGTCGIAYLQGAYLGPSLTEPDWGFSVTNTASPSCGPHVLAHELGHNLGSMHDRATSMEYDGSLSYGAYPFSFGFRQDGPPAFGTVMAYLAPGQRWIGLFSDPASAACGAACGVTGHSDNVRSLRLMAPRIALFRTPAGSLAIADVQLMEGNPRNASDGRRDYAWFRVRLGGPAPTEGVRFDIETVDGTAKAGVDFVANRATGLTIAAGEREAGFYVLLNSDESVEPDETFSVRLSNVSGATILDGEAVATIVNDDPRLELTGRLVFPAGSAPPAGEVPVYLYEDDGHSNEFQSTRAVPPEFRYRFAVSSGSRVEVAAHPLAPFVSERVSVGWVHADLVRDIDMQRGFLVTARLRMAEGVAPPTTPVDVEVLETFRGQYIDSRFYTASPPDFTVSHLSTPFSWTSVIVRPPAPLQPQRAALHRVSGNTDIDIVLHPTQPGLYLWSHPEVSEGAAGSRREDSIIAQLTAPAPAGGVRLEYSLVAGTATEGSDYAAVPGTVEFAEGETSKRIPFELIGDDLREPVETFSVRVHNVVGALPATPEFTLYIIDDDTKTGGGLRPDAGP